MKAFLVVVLALLAAGRAVAATAVAEQRVVVQIEPAATLRLDSGTVYFPPDDPLATGKITQTGAVNIEAEARTSDFQAVTLTALAASDLKSEENTIPIDALSWDATGMGYTQTGVLSDTQAQLLGSWNRSGSYDGTISYVLTNEWNYAAGTYTTTITYTLTAL